MESLTTNSTNLLDQPNVTNNLPYHRSTPSLVEVAKTPIPDAHDVILLGPTTKNKTMTKLKTKFFSVFPPNRSNRSIVKWNTFKLHEGQQIDIIVTSPAYKYKTQIVRRKSDGALDSDK
ncbi:hypothetical protein SNEBB_009988 [Seison nebaliae]|nr:hypothetical protein SNEBB_009988 [Seison nebaliae]